MAEPHWRKCNTRLDWTDAISDRYWPCSKKRYSRRISHGCRVSSRTSFTAGHLHTPMIQGLLPMQSNNLSTYTCTPGLDVLYRSLIPFDAIDKVLHSTSNPKVQYLPRDSVSIRCHAQRDVVLTLAATRVTTSCGRHGFCNDRLSNAVVTSRGTVASISPPSTCRGAFLST